MALNQILTYADMVNLQVAAEAFWQKLQSGVLPGDVLIQGNENNSREPVVIADLFKLDVPTSRYKVIAHQDLTLNDGKTVAGVNDKSGFSATLFLDTSNGQYTLSVRSTEFASSIRDSGDVKSDIAIGVDGWSFEQISSLETFWASLLQLNAVNGKNATVIPSYTDLGVFASQMSTGAKINVTGYSLGANIAEAFVEMHRTAVDHAYFFNGAGTGVPIAGQTVGSVLAKYQSVFANPVSHYGSLDLEKLPASIKAAYQQYQATPNATYQSVYDNPRHFLAEWAIYGLTDGAASRSLTGAISGASRTPDGQMVDLYASNYSGNSIIDTATASSGQRHGTSRPIWYEDQPASTWTNGDFSYWDWGQGHSIVLLQDSLNLMAMFEKFVPSVTEDKLAQVFRVASNVNYNSLEKTLDSLSRILGVSPTPVAAANADAQYADMALRNAFYDRLKLLQDSSIFQSLAGKVKIEAVHAAADAAHQDFAAFLSLTTGTTLSLRTLNAAAVEAALKGVYAAAYNDWQADRQALASGAVAETLNFTDTYLNDRSAFLNWRGAANAADNSYEIAIKGTSIANYTYTDLASGDSIKVRGTAVNSVYQESQKVVFGDGQDNGLVGSNAVAYGLGDRLYGGAGNDTISGLAGDDYLEGNAGNDVMRGGDGADFLMGGAGNDTYYFEGSFGLDTIRDADGAGVINVGSSTLSGGKKITEGLWVSGDKKFTFTLIDGNLIIRPGEGSGVSGSLTLKGWSNGQLGITLGDAPQPPPAPTLTRTIVGDLAPIDQDDTMAGMQPILDDLDNIASTTIEAGRVDGLNDSAGNDDVYGYGGDDWIRTSRGGDDRLDGGTGNDVIVDSGGGNDTLIGGDGLDILFGGVGDDRVYAAAVVSIEAALASNEPATGVQGELLDGSEGDDAMVGSAGNDAINGGRGADLIVAGAGDDNIRGDAEAYSGGAGSVWSVARTVTPNANGTNSYSAVYHNVNFTPTTTGGFNTTFGAGDSIVFTPIGEQVTTGDDVIFAGAGRDWVWGEYGHDYIDGGAGDDVLFGQEGSDLIVGGAGNDAIGGDGGGLADQGGDFLDGAEGNDTVSGNGGGDQLFGGTGDDMLIGDDEAAQYAGSDYLDGGAGADTLLGMGSSDRLFGGDGDDNLVGNLGSDELHGGEGADTLLGDNGTADALGDGDTLYGDAGNDQMEGGVGDDVVDGGEGNDLVIGDAGNDQLLGAAGDDQLQGGDGNDVLDAGEGNNSLFGQAGDDSLQAGSGNDYLDGGLGNDTLAGGDGNDVYHYKRGDGIDRFSDTSGTDRLILEGITWQELVLGTGSLKLSFAGGEIHLDDFDPDDPLASGGIEQFQFADGSVMSRTQLITALGMKPTGTAGPDVLSGTSLRDTISGLDGDDTLSGRAGVDDMDGGSGNDLLMGGDDQDHLYGGTGNDTLLGGAGGDLLRGFDGDDILDGGGGGFDQLDGGAGNDILLFGRSWGVTVSESLVFQGGTDTILLDNDVTPADVWVSRWEDNLFLTITGEDRQVRWDSPYLLVVNYFAGLTEEAVNPTGAVRQAVFADGTVWGVAEFAELARRTSERDDYVVLTAGDDVVDALNGADWVYGGDGADKLYGNIGADRMYGQLGDDVLYGGEGEDELHGHEGADLLDGGAGNDWLLTGGVGDDTLIGGEGNERLEGGVGNDTYVFGRGDGVDDVFDQDFLAGNIDTVQLAAGLTPADVSFTRDTRNLYISINGTTDRLKLTDWYFGDAYKVERVQFADGTVLQGDALLAKVSPLFDEGNNYGKGTAGNDTLNGLGGNDEIHGMEGDDLLIGGTGNDMLFGESGADTLDGGAGNDYLDGGIGNDTYTFGFGAGQNFVSDYDTNAGNFDTIQMAVGVAPSDVTVSRVGNHLHLALNGGADLLRVSDWFYSDAVKVERVVFADGTVWGVAELKVLVNPPANRAPVTSPDFADITEDGLPIDNGVPYVDGNVRANDVDPEGRVLEVTTRDRLPGAFGALYMSGDGGYVYLLEANASTAVQSLGIGDSLVDRIAYTVTDNDPRGAATATGEFTVTVHGSNDAPVLGADRAVIGEDDVAAIMGNVLANDHDVDANTSLTVSMNGVATSVYGALTMESNGGWSYALANASSAVQGLAAGQKVTDTFYFNVSDGDGAQVGGSLAIEITGRNDAPTLAIQMGDESIYATDTWMPVMPAGMFTDADNGDVLTYSATLVGGAALPSWMSFNAATQSFFAQAPSTVAGTFDIQLTATDTSGATAFEVISLTIVPKPVKGGGHGGHGNEGVGNGPDAPPPGHDDNHNDGPGTGPGHPGAHLHNKLMLIGSMPLDDMYF